MDEKTLKCVQCGESFPESEGKLWIPHHAAIPFLGNKYFNEPISGFRCKRCNNMGKRRFYFFLVFIAVLFSIIIIFSL
jgi:hypothetical protein